MRDIFLSGKNDACFRPIPIIRMRHDERLMYP